MQHSEGALAGSRGVKLFYQRWLPETEPRDAIALVHGIGGHGSAEPFRELISFLAGKGHAVYAMDLRGYGRSGGVAGHIESWNEYRADIQILLQQVRNDLPAANQFLLGESLGGLIVLDFLASVPNTLRGAIAAAPALKNSQLPGPLGPLLHFAANLQPTFAFAPPIDVHGLSRDAAKVQSYLADPLVNMTMTIRLFTEYEAAVERTMQAGAKIQTPVLLLHGTGDTIEPYERTEALFGTMGGTAKELILYPGAFHGLFMDTDAGQAMDDLESWITRTGS